MSSRILLLVPSPYAAQTPSGGRNGRGSFPPPPFPFSEGEEEGARLSAWAAGPVQPLALTVLGEHYHRYRLTDATAETDMVHSLHRYGQLSPVPVCQRQDTLEVVDGFKRLAAAARLGWPVISALSRSIPKRFTSMASSGVISKS